MAEDAPSAGQIMTVVSTQNRLIDIILEADVSNFAEWGYLAQVNMDGLWKGHLIEDCPTEAKATKLWLDDDKMLFPKNCELYQ